MPVANLVSARAAPQSTPPPKHMRLAKCRVLYIGCSVPLKTSVGLEAVQKPLAERYPINQDDKVDGIDAWVTIFSSGILLQYVGEQDSTLWFPIQNLYVCAAVKCMVTHNSDTGEKVPRFVSLDSDAAKGIQNSVHPPIFTAILRRSKGVKVLECHGFVAKSNQAALAMVKACTFAYKHEENWTDEPPPAEVMQNEVHYDSNGTLSSRGDHTMKTINSANGGYFYAGEGMIKSYDITNGMPGAPSRSQSMVRAPVPMAMVPNFRPPPPPGAIVRPVLRPPPPAVRPGFAPTRIMVPPPPRMMMGPGPPRLIGPPPRAMMRPLPPQLIRLPPQPMGNPPGRTVVRVGDNMLPQPTTTVIQVPQQPSIIEVPTQTRYRYTIKRTDTMSSRSSTSKSPSPPGENNAERNRSKSPKPGRQRSPRRRSRKRSKSPPHSSDETTEPKVPHARHSRRERRFSDTSIEIIHTDRQQRSRRPPSPPVDYSGRIPAPRLSRRDEYDIDNGDAHLELEKVRGPVRPVYVYYPQQDPRSRSMYVKGPYVERRYIPPGAIPPPRDSVMRPPMRALSQPPYMRRNRSPSPVRVKSKKSKSKKKSKKSSKSLTRHHSDQDVGVRDYPEVYNTEVFMKGPDDHWENMPPRDWQREERQFGNERAFGMSLKHDRNFTDNDDFNAYDMNRQGVASPELITNRTDLDDPRNGDDDRPSNDIERTLGYLP